MTWVEPDQCYAQLASFHAAAALFITDDTGRVLLVKPNYRDHWAIPGGYVDQQETPHAAAGRELREELGLAMDVGDLLVVDWASPAGPRPRALVNFIFDGGRLTSNHSIRVSSDELEPSDSTTPSSAGACSHHASHHASTPRSPPEPKARRSTSQTEHRPRSPDGVSRSESPEASAHATSPEEACDFTEAVQARTRPPARTTSPEPTAIGAAPAPMGKRGLSAKPAGVSPTETKVARRCAE